MSSDTAADVVNVINVVNLYPIAVDTLRFDLFDQVFTQDARFDFGGPAQWHDLASIKRDFATIHQPFQATQHSTANHRVAVDGDRANCISYVHARFVRAVPDGENMFEGCGWYDDVLQRTAAGWRITVRVSRTLWSGGNPKVMQTMPGVTVELQHHALSAEAAAGRVAYLEALTRRSSK